MPHEPTTQAARAASVEAAEAELRRRLDGRRPVFFLDYDGTLTPIVARPEMATLADEMRDVLRRLAGLCTVAVVSGRDRPDVEQLVALDGLIYAGSHGFDIEGPNGLHKEHQQARMRLPSLDNAERDLRARIRDIPGVLIERKRFAIAVHYRNVEADAVPRVEDAVDATVRAFGDLKKTGGKKVYEVRPAVDWDKGKAVLWLIQALGLDDPEVVPIYLGDDETDEDAFRALSERGLGVFVGSGERTESAAPVRLESVDDVRELLSRAADLLERGS